MNNEKEYYDAVLFTNQALNYNFKNNDLTQCYLKYNKDGINPYKTNKVLYFDLFNDVLKLGEIVYKYVESIDSILDSIIWWNKNYSSDNSELEKALVFFYDKYGFEESLFEDDNCCFHTIKHLKISLHIYAIYKLKEMLIKKKYLEMYRLIQKSNHLKDCLPRKNINIENYNIFKESKKQIIEIYTYYYEALILDGLHYLYNGELYKDHNSTFFEITASGEERNNYHKLRAELDIPDNSKDFGLYRTIYEIRDCFVAAFEYLIRSINNNYIYDFIPSCEICGTLLDRKVPLCTSCIIKYGQDKVDNPRKNLKEETKKAIIDEIEDLKNNIYVNNSVILSLYVDAKGHKEKYKNKRASK